MMEDNIKIDRVRSAYFIHLSPYMEEVVSS
jgi:hypothetical protein